MSKPLSEQVAELERRLEAVGEQYLETRRLNTELYRERDDARAQGISDLNRIHRQKATIRRLEEENAALRAGQGRWRDGDDSPAGEQVPRVITADELTLGAGQWIAYRNYNPPHEWMVEKYDKDEFSPRYDGTIVLLADAPTSDDDAQITDIHGRKRYVGQGETPGVVIEIGTAY